MLADAQVKRLIVCVITSISIRVVWPERTTANVASAAQDAKQPTEPAETRGTSALRLAVRRTRAHPPGRMDTYSRTVGDKRKNMVGGSLQGSRGAHFPCLG